MTTEVKKRDEEYTFKSDNSLVTEERALELLADYHDCSVEIAQTNLDVAKVACERDKKPKGFNDKDGNLIISVEHEDSDNGE